MTDHDPAGNERVPSQHERRFVDTPFFDQLPHAGAAHPDTAQQNRLDEANLEAVFMAPTDQSLGAALASLTKTQIATHPDLTDSETLDQQLRDKIMRR